MVRMRTWLLTGVLVLFALVLAARPALAATYSVTITATQFIPATLQVSAGDQITFLNSTTATQSAVTTDVNGFNTGNIGPGQSKTVTVSTAGTFAYSSAFNSSLTGTVTVLESSTEITSTTSGTTTTVTTTQEQPVSGVFEVILAMVAGGFGFIGFGWYAARRSGFIAHDPVVNLPLISSSVEEPRDAQRP